MTAAALASPCVLVVEDEPRLARLLVDYLVAAGLQAHALDNGLAVQPWVEAQRPALIVLDLMLPGRDGLAVCQALRAHADPAVQGVAILMLTARVEEVDRLIGLEAGADDYVCKPFSPREVVARVKAILRRQQRPLPVAVLGAASAGPAATAGGPGAVGVAGPAPTPALPAAPASPVAPEGPGAARALESRAAPGAQRAPGAPAAPGLVIDAAAYRATLDGQGLDLTPLEFRLLRTFAEAPGRVWSRDQLLDRLHDDQRALSDRTVDSHIKNLRRKLEAAAPGRDAIRSVYGVGYRLEL